MQRFGMVIGLQEAREKEYRALHQQPGVRDLLRKANIQNFSIFLHRLPDGLLYEFGYYEYVGTNYEDDMAQLAAEPRHTEWLQMCDPMQLPLPGESSWAPMEQIYFNA